MALTDYMPKTDGELLVWFNNFQTKFATYGPTLGFVAADVTGVNNDYQMLAFVIQAAAAVQGESAARTRYKNTLRDGPARSVQPPIPTVPVVPVPATIVEPGIVPRLRATVQRIKSHPAYTESIGNDLGIIGTASAPTATRPDASASAEPGSAVRIDWTKAGYDGVLVEGQRGDEVIWTNLGTDMQSPYTDTRTPLQVGAPEVRRYRLRYVKGDVASGDYTDTMTVTTTP